MNVDQLLNAFGKAHDLPADLLDASGNARLAFEGRAVNIQYLRGEDALILQACLPVPHEADSRLYPVFLAANRFHNGPEDAILALDEAARELVLLVRLEREFALERLELALARLLDEHEAWASYLTERKQEGEAAAVFGMPAMAPMNFA